MTTPADIVEQQLARFDAESLDSVADMLSHLADETAARPSADMATVAEVFRILSTLVRTEADARAHRLLAQLTEPPNPPDPLRHLAGFTAPQLELMARATVGAVDGRPDDPNTAMVSALGRLLDDVAAQRRQDPR